MESLVRYWPIVLSFVGVIVFIVRLEFMIQNIKLTQDAARVQYAENKEKAVRTELQVAVLTEKLSNIEKNIEVSMGRVEKLISVALAEIRGTDYRRGDRRDNA